MYRFVKSVVSVAPQCRRLLCQQNLQPMVVSTFSSADFSFRQSSAYSTAANPTSRTTYVKLVGIPWKSTPEDVVEFLGVKISPEDVIIEMDNRGFYNSMYRDTGISFVKINREFLPEVLKKDMDYMKYRYIKVEEASGFEMEKIIPQQLEFKRMKSAGSLPSFKLAPVEVPENQVYVRLKGMPYKTSRREIEHFMSGVEVHEILFGLEVHANSTRKRSDGTAYVLVDKENLEKTLAKDYEYINNRYILVGEATNDDLKYRIPISKEYS